MDSFIDSCPNNIQGASGALFVNLINTLFAAQCSLSQDNLYPSSYSSYLNEDNKFDFVVVGSGSAGAVVASRISEDSSVRVLLIEAGTIPSVTTELPTFLYTLQNTPEDWHYRPEPSDKACIGMKDGRCVWPRGKVLGGTSAINGALYLRGNQHDYDNWAKLNPGWDYKTVMKYYKKMENILPAYHKSTGKYGTKGPITLDQFASKHPLRQKIIEAAKTLGQNFYPEEVPVGYFDVLNNIENGTRVSSAKGYLSKIGKRPNLYIAMKCQVGRIIFDGNRAVGVEYKFENKIKKVYATKEVIISAGAINSPQILLSSGVGPKAALEKLGIKVVLDLPGVGQNLQDHNMFPGVTVSMDDGLIYPYDDTEEAYKFFAQRKGLYSTIDLMSFVGTINFSNKTDNPDIECFNHVFAKGQTAGYGVFSKARGFDQEMIDGEMELIKKRALHRIMFCVSHPESRGHLELKSSDPYEYPIIYANYLSDPNDHDFNMLLKGINYLKKLYTAKPFDGYNVKIEKPRLKYCMNFTNDDDYYRCAIKNIATTVYHMGGTCKMGPKDDKMAVVDAQLKVHGIFGLRIVDASIMPVVTSINTNGPTMMIGERASDFIKNDWHLNNSCPH